MKVKRMKMGSFAKVAREVSFMRLGAGLKSGPKKAAPTVNPKQRDEE